DYYCGSYRSGGNYMF
nr:immunoglobulin light chain junction region [Macaca mulatta]